MSADHNVRRVDWRARWPCSWSVATRKQTKRPVRGLIRAQAARPEKGLLDFAIIPPAASSGFEPCSAAMKAASAVSKPLF